MKITTSDGECIYKLDSLRISGSIDEVNEFLDWLVKQNPYSLIEYDAISIRGTKSISIVIEFPCPGDQDDLAKYAKEDLKYGLATLAPPGTGNDESPEIEF